MKRNLILIVTLLCLNSTLLSQWTYSKGNTDFDGSYKTSSVKGNGGAYPFTKPLFVVNKFDNDTPNIYITDAGYSGCDNKQILFKFNGDDVIYETNYVTEGRENESWFIRSFKNIDLVEFLILLKTKSLMSVRMLSNCSKKDYKFSLKGSTKAINFVLGEEYFKVYEENKKNQLIEKERVIKEVKERSKFLIDSLKRTNSLEIIVKKYQRLMDKFSKDNYEFYEVYSNSATFYKGVPLKIARNQIEIKKGKLVVIDSNFDSGKFRRVEFIEGVGIKTYYVLKNRGLKKRNKDEIKNLLLALEK